MSVGGPTVVCVTRPSGTARATGGYQYGAVPLARGKTASAEAAASPKLALVESAGAQVVEAKVLGLEAAGPQVAELEVGRQAAESEVGRLEFAEIEFAVIDLETTGWSPGKAAITEVAAVRVRGGRRQGEFASLIPVRSSMPGGTGTPGLTSEANSPWRRPPRTLTAATSVIAAAPGDHPVVSRSITANSISANSSRPTSSSATCSPATCAPAGSTRASFGGAAAPAEAVSPRASDTAPYWYPPVARAVPLGLVTHTTVGPPTDISAADAPAHPGQHASGALTDPQLGVAGAESGLGGERERASRAGRATFLTHRYCPATGFQRSPYIIVCR